VYLDSDDYGASKATVYYSLFRGRNIYVG